MIPIALADLGAGLDAAITASGVTGNWVRGALRRIVIAARVTSSTAVVRLYRRDAQLGRWVPSRVAALTLDPAVDAGVAELRYEPGGVDGHYALVQESGSGTVVYTLQVAQ